MTLEELRNQIDALDRQLVELLSERARAAQKIGHLKVEDEPATVWQSWRAKGRSSLVVRGQQRPTAGHLS